MALAGQPRPCETHLYKGTPFLARTKRSQKISFSIISHRGLRLPVQGAAAITTHQPQLNRRKGKFGIVFFSLRPCAFFFYVSRHFFFTKPTRARGKKKQNVQRKKRTGSVFQTTWPTKDAPSSLCWAQSFFFFLNFFPNDDKVKQLPVARLATVRNFDFFPVAFFADKERFWLFSTDKHRGRFRLPALRSLAKCEALTWFRFQIKHESIVLSKQNLIRHYPQQSPCLAISTGGIEAFGSPWPDSLAEDCRLIIARRHWNLLKFLTNVHECKASCFLKNECCETLI